MVADQQEFEGMRPKRIVAIEEAARKLVGAKAAQKRAKETVDECAEDVARALRKAGESTYGWKERGRLITVTLEDSEKVKVTAVRSGDSGDE